jgi:hypothetical protein
MRYFLITEELLDAVRDVLAAQPYGEVANLIGNLDALETAVFPEEPPVPPLDVVWNPGEVQS